MPVPPILKINQIFASVQGEGAYAGTPAIFIRMSGCSLRCDGCDSKAAWDSGDTLDVEAIKGQVLRLRERYPAALLVITGGEPGEQDLGELLAGVRPFFPRIAIETNALHFQDLPIDWWTLSPKAAAGYRIHPRIIPLISEVKLIADDNLELDVIKKVRLLSDVFPIYIQPRHGLPRALEIAHAQFVQYVQAGIPNLRLGFQLHRIYDIP